MRKVLGLLTEDFRLYHDLVAALKARDLPFVSLSFSRRIPDTVGAVLTSPAEAGRVRHRHAVAVDDIDSSIAKAIQILKGKSYWTELLIGVDPGREPGVAILGDGDVIDTRIAASPEAVAFHVRQAIRTFPANDARVRIGHGDPTNRNRILNAVSRDRTRLEIVDEARTTRLLAHPDAYDAFQEVDEIFPALRDLIYNSRAPVRRKDGRPVDEPPLEQLRELLVDGGSPDLEFFRQVFRMIEPLGQQSQDLASRLRGRDANQLQNLWHPGRRVVSAYFNVLPAGVVRHLPAGRGCRARGRGCH